MKIEVGKRYKAISRSCLQFEIVKRAAKCVTYREVWHAGRDDESKSEPKTATIKIFKNSDEMFITAGGATIIAFFVAR